MALSSTGGTNSTPSRASYRATCRTSSSQDVATAGPLVRIPTMFWKLHPRNRVSELTCQLSCEILQDSSP